MHRLTSDLTPIDFCIPILVSLNYGYMWQRVGNCDDSRCVVATNNHNRTPLSLVNDNGPSTDEYENGTKAAGSVMKAAGRVMKVKRICVIH